MSKLLRSQALKQTASSRCKHIPALHASRRQPDDLDLLLGGRGGSSSKKQPGKLILPGQNQQPNMPQRLFVPDEARSGAPSGGSGVLELVEDSGVGVAPTYNKYRPPPKFMEGILKEDDIDMDPSEMLSKLRSRSGYWHQLARYFPVLNKAGYDSPSIDVETGITSAEQSRWYVASTLYDSLKSSNVSQKVMDYLDRDGDVLLYPFRFLGKDQRAVAAQYICEKRLDAEMCLVLARAMKEWERRPQERTGFSDHPGDCLAFKYLRDAGETKDPDVIAAKVEQGLAVAVTSTAVKRLKAVLAQDEDEGGVSFRASLMSLRFTQEEQGFRAVPLLGTLEQVTPFQLLTAPKSSSGGPFGAMTFTAEAPNYQWVVLPQWKAIAMAPCPMAISVAECTNLAPIMALTRGKTKDEMKKFRGPGMLVVERWIEGNVISLDRFYLLDAGAGVKLEEGGSVSDPQKVLAEVLFLARPAIRESKMESAEMMSV